MKPHLPVALFRSLVAALAAFPLLVYGSREDVPANYDDYEIFEINDLKAVQTTGAAMQKSAFLLTGAGITTEVGNPALTWEEGALVISATKELFFTSLDDSRRCNVNMSNGDNLGPVLVAGDISFVTLNDIDINDREITVNLGDGNSILQDSGALKVAGLEVSDNLGRFRNFTNTNARILFEENRNISISKNGLNGTTKHGMMTVSSYQMGGAVCAPNVIFERNKRINIDNNYIISASESLQTDSSAAYGGAIYAGNVSIIDNEVVSVSGNTIRATTSGKPVGTVYAAGGAFYITNSLVVEGNVSVSFANNAELYSCQDETRYYMRSVVVESDNRGFVRLAAGVSNLIDFQEGITVDCDMTLNGDFYGDGGTTLRDAEGDIIFSAQNVERNLRAFKQNQPSDEELLMSRTTFVQGTTTLKGGRMMVQHGAIFSGGGIQVERHSGATVYLEKGGSLALMPTMNNLNTQQMGDGRLVLGAETNLYVRDDLSSISAAGIVFEGKNTLTFDLTANNVLNPAVMIDSDITFGSEITVYLTSDGKLTNQQGYKLFQLGDGFNMEGWNSANITVISNKDTGYEASYANLRWDNNVMYYYTVLPPLLDATWVNNEEDFVWSSQAINWEQKGQFYAFSNGATVTFGDVGHGEIKLKGELEPSNILVNNSANADYVWVAHEDGGYIAGDTKLTKQGEGSLVIKLANKYTGGTEVLGGKLVAGHAEAFGTGDITVDGGSLDLTDKAVKNNVTVNTGGFSGSAYAGELTVLGAAEIGDNSTAALVTLKGATLTGGSLKDTDVVSQGATIETKLTGTTNLTVQGETVLNGDHDSTGTTTIKSGTLLVQGSMTSDIDLQGGTFRTEASPMVLAPGQDVVLNGGKFAGSVMTQSDSSLAVNVSSNMEGDLTFAGGVYTPGGPGITLQLLRALSIQAPTTVNLEHYEDSGMYTLIAARTITGDVSNLTPVSSTRNTNTLMVQGQNLILTVQENPATLHWMAGVEGKWEALGNQLWDTTEADARFFNRDYVVFDKGGKVEIVGDVRPADVLIDGQDEVSFVGSGSIVGNTKVTKRGSSVLNMNAVNTYTGATIVEDGTVNAGGEASFGSSTIDLRGGRLDMKSHAVRNDVVAIGGEFAGTAYDGKLTVRGNIAVGADTTAASVVMEKGLISGESLRDTDIVATGEGEISATIKDAATVTVDGGNLLLSGKNAYTGKTTVNSGVLSFGREESVGSGDIVLNGGRASMAPGQTLALTGKQKLVFNGGTMEGNVRTSNVAGIVLDTNATIAGNLRLNGGTVYYNAYDKEKVEKLQTGSYMASNGCTLTISGAVNVTSDTLLLLQSGQYTDGDVLLECDSLTGDFGYLVLDYDDGNPNTEYTLTQVTTPEGKTQLLLDLDKVFESTGNKWTMNQGDLRDLLVQSNWGLMAASHAFTDAMQGQRSASGVVGENGPMLWVSALYSHMTVDDDKGLSGADTATYGAAIGVERMIGQSSCVGLALGVTSADVSPSGMAEEMEQEGIYLGVYGATVLSRLSDRSGLTLSWTAAYGTIDSSPSTSGGVVEWSQESWQLGARLDWSYALSEGTTVNVFGGLEYFATNSDVSAGVESGEIQNVRAEFGVGITRSFSATVLYAEARYINDVARDNPTPVIGGWSAEGANPGRSGFGLRLGAAHDINQNWSVGANYGVEVMGDAVDHNVNVSASFKF